MTVWSPAFPTRRQLWDGVVLGTIAHSIWQASDEEFAPDQQWDGHNYGLNNEQGARGTITFAPEGVVGVFCDVRSVRNPWHSEVPYDPHTFLATAPGPLLAIAERETLQYQLFDFRGAVAPVITAAFWSQGERLTAAEPWSTVVVNGAHLLRIQLMETERAVGEWQENYEFSIAQVALLRTLFERRVALRDLPIRLQSEELVVLKAAGDAGIERSRSLLEAIGILLG